MASWKASSSDSRRSWTSPRRRRPSSRADVDDDREVGDEAVDGPHLQVVDLGRAEVAPAPW